MRVSVLLLYFLLNLAHGAKVLVTVVGLSGSQNLIMYRFADLIASRGNDVTILKAEIFPEAKVPKLKFAKEMKYKLIENEEIIEQARSNLSAIPWETTAASPIPLKQLFAILSHVVQGCNTLLNNEKMMKHFSDSKYDVIIIHMIDFCAFGIAEALNIPTVWMSTAFLLEPMAYYSGVPFPTSYIPATSHAVSDVMKFSERLRNLLLSSVTVSACEFFVLPGFTAILREHYGAEFPALPQILAKTQLYFVNSDPFFDFPRPIQHNIIYVGGLTMQHPENLNEEWAAIVKNAKPKGIVLFSLGTVVQTKNMPKHWKMAFLNAFKRFPDYTFIWRLEGDFPEAKSAANVVISNWLPQKDLLGLPEVKAFITHGGYNSLTETVHYGVPVVVMPLFGDQYANAQRVLRHGVGRVLDKSNISGDTIHKALNEILGNHQLQDRADALSRMLQNLPVAPADLAVNWVKYLAKFKNLTSLQPSSRNLNFVTLNNLDVIAFIGAVMCTLLYVLWFIIRGVIRKVFGWYTGRKHKHD